MKTNAFNRYCTALRSLNDFITIARKNRITFDICDIIKTVSVQNNVDSQTVTEVYCGVLDIDRLRSMLNA